jgi:hypothetical protein
MSATRSTPRKVLAEVVGGKIEEGNATSTTTADPRKVLAEFVVSIEKGKGWWYRVPNSGNDGAPNDSMHPDCIMPQLGALFSLEESAMAAMLRQMGFYHNTNYNKMGKGFAFKREGWDNLAAEFKIPLISWELATYKLCNHSRCHYIKIGNISMNPQQIYAKFKANPKEYRIPSVATPQSRALVVDSLAQGQRESDAAAEIAANAFAEKKKAREDKKSKGEEVSKVASLKDTNQAAGVSKGAATAVSDSVSHMFRDDFSAGTVADYSSPVLQHFGVPIDNHSTLARLHLEVTKALLACQKASAAIKPTGEKVAVQPTGEKVAIQPTDEQVAIQPTGKFSTTNGFLDAVIYKVPGAKHTYSSIMIPQGRSSATITKLKRTITAMTEYCIQSKGEEDEGAQNCIRQVIGEFEKSYPDEFLKVCVSKGYSTSKAGKIPAEFWNAMAEETRLSMTQQRTVNRYLTHHFGASVRVSEKELRQVTDPDTINKEKATVAEGAQRNLKRAPESLEKDTVAYGAKRNLKRAPESLEKDTVAYGAKQNLKRAPEPLGEERGTKIEREIRMRISASLNASLLKERDYHKSMAERAASQKNVCLQQSSTLQQLHAINKEKATVAEGVERNLKRAPESLEKDTVEEGFKRNLKRAPGSLDEERGTQLEREIKMRINASYRK